MLKPASLFIFYLQLNNCVVVNNRVFRYDDNAFANVVTAVFAVFIIDALAVEELDVFADARVFVDDGARDEAVFADAYMRHSAFDVFADFLD